MKNIETIEKSKEKKEKEIKKEEIKKYRELFFKRLEEIIKKYS